MMVAYSCVNLCKFFTGWGVFATKEHPRESFLLQYVGELVSAEEAEKREKRYAKKNLGSYLFFFSNKGKEYW